MVRDSEFHDREFFKRFGPSQPRDVKGGIRARSNRGVFGNSWWATRWIEVLESFDIGSRLQRGKSYARRGQVLSVDIGEGHVKSLVQGSSRAPYMVEIKIKPITPEKWLELSRTSLNQIVVASKLVSGQMPENIEQLFAEKGASFFPAKSDDLKTSCSCPDYSNPCKHIAAVYYLLAEEFDRDPFLIFTLRGLEKDKLLDQILGIRVSASNDESSPGEQKSTVTKQPNKTTKRKKKTGAEPEVTTIKPNADGDADADANADANKLSTDPQTFWGHAFDPETQREARLPLLTASLVRRLGPLPFWRSRFDLVSSLMPVYQRASDQALIKLAQTASEEDSSL